MAVNALGKYILKDDNFRKVAKATGSSRQNLWQQAHRKGIDGLKTGTLKKLAAYYKTSPGQFLDQLIALEEKEDDS